MRRIKENTIKGIISFGSYGKAFIKNEEDREQKIFISKKNTNRAFPGDKVSLKIKYSQKNQRREGRVIKVLERKKTHFVGVLEINENFGFVNITEKNIFTDFYISPENINAHKEGEKVVVKLLDWPKENKSPFGKIISSFGKGGMYETEIKSILYENKIREKFPKEVLEELKKTEKEEKLSGKRKDLREETTFTIDPISAKDFDDAISFKKKEGGVKKIGVHIADVTHYIKPGTALDKEAYKRGTSLYLPDRVIPMLPEKISNGLCSLNPYEEKKTFSFIFELTKEGEIKNGRFEKTLIRSKRRFAYEEVQFIIEKKEKIIPKEVSISKKKETVENDIIEAIHELNKFSKERRKKRKEKGSLSFEKKEMEFILSETKEPTEIKIKQNKEANQLVEELMLIANTHAAKYMSEKRKEHPFIYRTHDKPDEQKLSVLKKIIEPMGYFIETKGENVNKQLNDILRQSRGKKEENLIDTLVIRSMSKAEYKTKNIGHYGLSFSHYTHFTSPIRRYSDILAHRILLKAAHGGGKENKIELKEKCSHVTEREIISTKTEREGNKLMQIKFLEKIIGEQKKGFISGVTEGGVFVEIIENKCEGFILKKNLGEERFYFNEEKISLEGEQTKKKYSLGDDIEIIIRKVDFKKRQVYFALFTKEASSGFEPL